MFLKVITILVLIIFLIFGIDTISKIKKCEGKLIDDVRKNLIIRIDILLVLTVVLAVLTILNVFIKK